MPRPARWPWGRRPPSPPGTRRYRRCARPSGEHHHQRSRCNVLKMGSWWRFWRSNRLLTHLKKYISISVGLVWRDLQRSKWWIYTPKLVIRGPNHYWHPSSNPAKWYSLLPPISPEKYQKTSQIPSHIRQHQGKKKTSHIPKSSSKSHPPSKNGCPEQIIIIGITNNNSGYNTNNSDYIWLYDGIIYIYIT